MSRRLTRPALAALTAAVLLPAAPAAYGIWSAAGSGTVTAGTATPLPVTIAPGITTTQALYPTRTPTGDVAVAVTNPNPYRVHVGSFALDGGGFSANAAACGLVFIPPRGAGWDIAAGATITIDLRDSLTMATSAPASCQGLAVRVALRVAP